MRIAICEDSPQHLEILLALIGRYITARPGLDMQTFSFNCGSALLESIESGESYNLFLLDIIMPCLNGIELAGEIRKSDSDVPIAFLTSSADYALDAFGLQAAQYLLKPVKQDTLFPILDKIVSSRQRGEDSFIMVSTQDSKVKIHFSNIACVESVERTMRFCFADGSTLSSKTIREPFAAIINPLLEDGRFLYPHKSFVLNMELVEELTPNSFKLKGGAEVPIPRYRYADSKNKYLSYLSSRGVNVLGSRSIPGKSAQ